MKHYWVWIEKGSKQDGMPAMGKLGVLLLINIPYRAGTAGAQCGWSICMCVRRARATGRTYYEQYIPRPCSPSACQWRWEVHAAMS